MKNNFVMEFYIEYLDESIEPIEFAIDLLDYFKGYEEFVFNEPFFDTLYGSSDLRFGY